MSSVYFDPAVGGDGSTVTDDANASTGLGNGGHRTRFVPAMGQVVAVADFVVTTAGDVSVDATAAAASASAAAVSQTAAATSASNAAASALSAASIAAGVLATSTTSLTIGTGSKSLTIQTGKQFDAGQFCTIASVADPANYMWGQVTSYTSGTGDLVVNVTVTGGSGTIASWAVSVSGSRGATGPTGASGVSTVGYSARTSNTLLSTADHGYFIDITSGTFTQTFAAAATLGDGWWCYLRNSGSGEITVDPNASETIDGQLTGVAYPGCTYLVVCTGTGFTVVKVAGKRTELKTSGTSWTAPMGVWAVKARVQGAGGSGGSNSSTYYAGAGGGGGGYFEETVKTSPGTSLSYSVGSGGNSVTTSAGVAGGNSTFNGHTAAGGAGGSETGYGTPTAGGAASGGDVNINGGPSYAGSGCESAGGSLLSMSRGGDSRLGSGGSPSHLGSAVGAAAVGYGSGGCGVRNNSASGAGMPGCIILEY